MKKTLVKDEKLNAQTVLVARTTKNNLCPEKKEKRYHFRIPLPHFAVHQHNYCYFIIFSFIFLFCCVWFCFFRWRRWFCFRSTADRTECGYVSLCSWALLILISFRWNNKWKWKKKTETRIDFSGFHVWSRLQ